MTVPITLSNNTPADADDVMENFQSLDADITAKGAPSGSVLLWTTNTPPSNWLLCDGSAVSRATYAALFSVIGTTYGVGDGSTTFNLPNLKGKVPFGRDAGQTEFDTLGETGGAKSVTETTTGTTVSYFSNAGDENVPDADINHTHNVTVDILPPYLVLNYIIKT